MEIHVSLTRTLLFILFAGVMLAGTAQAATLYKWTDEEGNVHYSQSPPENLKADRMQVKDEAQQQQPTEPQADDAAPPEGAGQDPAVVEARRLNCETARINLQTYKDSDKVRQPDGTVITLSDEMREAKIKEAQAMVDANCK